MKVKKKERILTSSKNSLIATSTSLTTTISSSDWAFNVSITLMPTYYADEGGWDGERCGEESSGGVQGRREREDEDERGQEGG